ncbi:hypothetical protein chiPu_0001157 [Chiloscyllium punctatum]|uniref:Uncharacterized protein n=1 Tax=Chiloscyllium punctatum TaxID=137246 RepID=A0A401RX93_CHIPU|nr:hypothetical protein [Chiloscyllium punctatum]
MRALLLEGGGWWWGEGKEQQQEAAQQPGGRGRVSAVPGTAELLSTDIITPLTELENLQFLKLVRLYFSTIFLQ